jgi:hypothetical protein
MRYKFFILINILLLILCSPIRAEDVILGTLISVDEQNGKLLIRHLGGDDKNTEDITVIMDKDFRLDQVEIGSVVRVWGSYLDAKTTLFRCTKISSERFRSQDDPTGVRFRLRMGADPMRLPPPPRPR